MKYLLKLLCLVALVYCFYFPLTYFHSEADKKEIRISHVLNESPNKLDEARQDIMNGLKSFEDVVNEYSQCEESKDKKGDLGYNTQNGTLDKRFEKVAFNLPLKEISDPVHSAYGWHLIKVTDIKYFSDKDNFAFKY